MKGGYAVRYSFAGVKQMPKGQFGIRAGRVINPRSIFFDQFNDEFSQVTHIDDLDGCVRSVWRDHIAAAFDTHRPIREAIRWVIRTHDQSGAEDKCTVTIDFLYRFFA